MADGSTPAKFAAGSHTELCRAKLFMHGGSQAVRLPKAFRFDGAEVSVRREGAAVILEPIQSDRPPSLEEIEAFFAKSDAIRGDLEIVLPPRERTPWRDPPVW